MLLLLLLVVLMLQLVVVLITIGRIPRRSRVVPASLCIPRTPGFALRRKPGRRRRRKHPVRRLAGVLQCLQAQRSVRQRVVLLRRGRMRGLCYGLCSS